eukprot:gene860-9109_t
MKIKQPTTNEQKLQVTVKNNQIVFGNPNSHDNATVTFERTLRIPDDGKVYPLPPSFGHFPVEKVDDYLDKVPESWRQHGGVFIPMYQREAMWMQFGGSNSAPKAMKIAVGKINALNGKTWDQKLDKTENDYVVIPDQPWLDGINSGNGTIKQFVAMPLGNGYTVEGQVSGKEEFGGIQLCVYDCEEQNKKKIEQHRHSGLKKKKSKNMNQSYSFSMMKTKSFDCAQMMEDDCFEQEEECDFAEAKEMGLSAGGKMKQKIYKDKRVLKFWNEDKTGRVFVHIVNSSMYQKITGKEPPKTIISSKTYTDYGYPWYDIWDENKKSIKPSNILSQVKSVKEIDQEKYSWPQQDDESVFINNVYPTKKNSNEVRDGLW